MGMQQSQTQESETWSDPISVSFHSHYSNNHQMNRHTLRKFQDSVGSEWRLTAAGQFRTANWAARHVVR